MADRRNRFSPTRMVDTAERIVGSAQELGVIKNRCTRCAEISRASPISERCSIATRR